MQEIAGRTYSEVKHHLEKGKTSLKHPVKVTDKNQPRDLRTAAQTALGLGRTTLPRNFSPRGHQQGKTALPLTLYSYECWALLNRAHSAQEKQHSTSKQQHGQKIFDTTDWKKWNNYPQCTEITDVHKPQGHGFPISRTATTQKLTAAAHQKWLGKSKQETNTEFHRAILMHQRTETRDVKQDWNCPFQTEQKECWTWHKGMRLSRDLPHQWQPAANKSKLQQSVHHRQCQSSSILNQRNKECLWC